MRAVSLAGSRRWKALESLTAGSSSPEPPGQLIATDMGAIRSQSVGWVCDGYGPQQAYLWYRERDAALQPDLVIFAV